MSPPRRGGAAPLLLAVLLAGCGRTAPEPPAAAGAAKAELLPVPEPDLSNAEPAVGRQVRERQAELRGLLDTDAPAAELAEAFGRLGLLYVTYSFIEAAEVAFLNAETLAPEDHRWPYVLGYLYQIQGRLEEAEARLGRALELRGDDRPSMLRLGTVRLELGRPEEAAELFQRVLDSDPDSAAALDGLGKVAAATGDTETAVRRFERVLELQPTASSVRHALGLAYRKLGRMEEARQALAQGGDAAVLFEDPVLAAVTELGKSSELYLVRAAQAFAEERYELAATYYRRALDADPHDFTTRKALGFCLEKLGDVDGAMEQLHLALDGATTGDPERDRAERAEVYRILGGLEVLHGREAAAIEHFEAALELDPDHHDARLKLANALARHGRLVEAVAHYDKLVAAFPDQAELRVKRATALVNLGRTEAALADFEQAVAAAPDDPEVRRRYAEALDFLGRSEAAAAQRSAVARLSTGDEQRARLLVEEAFAHLQRGELEPALAGYREAVRLAPGDSDARYQLGALLGHFGRYDEAVTELQRVIADAPRHGPARRALATALLLEGRYGAARHQLEEALTALPRDGELAHLLARLLAAAPDARVRDGRLAVELAGKVHAVRKQRSTAETLALAYAEAGRFDRAVELQRQVIAAAGEAELPALEERLHAFERGTAWHASSPAEILAVLSPPGPRQGG